MKWLFLLNRLRIKTKMKIVSARMVSIFFQEVEAAIGIMEVVIALHERLVWFPERATALEECCQWSKKKFNEILGCGKLADIAIELQQYSSFWIAECLLCRNLISPVSTRNYKNFPFPSTMYSRCLIDYLPHTLIAWAIPKTLPLKMEFLV